MENQPNHWRWAILIILLPMVLTGLVLLFNRGSTSCGDGICQENCTSCPEDCACSAEQIKAEKPKAAPIPVASECGNSICESGEYCGNCGADCPCAPAQYCDRENQRCQTVICGNQRCEPFESSLTCCMDCPCQTKDMSCNQGTGACQYPVSTMTEQQVKERAASFFQDRGQKVGSYLSIASQVYQGKPAKRVKVMLEGQTYPSAVLVVEDGPVILLPTI